MKKIVLISSLLFTISVQAQTTCPSDTSKRWDNCVGTYTHANGNKYVGEWQDDKRHGQGTYTFANGDKYVGEFLDGLQDGQGTYTWSSGAQYVGAWKDNERHGEATYTPAIGNTRIGVWENDTYFGTKSAWDKKEKERKAKAERERIARETAQKKYNKIYNTCLLDKSSGVDMQVSSLRRAVEETCESIAEDPSWLENLRYN